MKVAATTFTKERRHVQVCVPLQVLIEFPMFGSDLMMLA